MSLDKRIKNEINHGKFISEKGEAIWNWSSPAGKIRWQRRSNIFKNFLGNNNKTVLEIGCGTGIFTKEIAGTNNRIFAVDISNDLLEIAKKRIPKDNVIFKVENAYQTDFDDNFFDFIIGSSVLHHLEIDLAAKEFFRVLKPNGKLIFTEPNMLNPQIALQKNIPFLKKYLGDSPDETAFIRWVLKRKLTTAGFKKIDIVPFDFIHPLLPIKLLKIASLFNSLEKIPIIKEIAGSLIIKAEK